MLSSLTLSQSVSTQSEAAWEVHTIPTRAVPPLIRLEKGEVVIAMVTSIHLHLYILTYGIINRLLPSLLWFFSSSEENGGEPSVQACSSGSVYVKLLMSKCDLCVLFHKL